MTGAGDREAVGIDRGGRTRLGVRVEADPRLTGDIHEAAGHGRHAATGHDGDAGRDEAGALDSSAVAAGQSQVRADRGAAHGPATGVEPNGRGPRRSGERHARVLERPTVLEVDTLSLVLLLRLLDYVDPARRAVGREPGEAVRGVRGDPNPQVVHRAARRAEQA